MSAVSGHIVNEARPSVSIGITPTAVNQQNGSAVPASISKVSVEVTLSPAGQALSDQANSVKPESEAKPAQRPDEETATDKTNCQCDKAPVADNKDPQDNTVVDKTTESEEDDSYGFGKYIKAAAGIGSIIALFA
ncbi:hypothetical protein [Shewanella waksmanii]|uniref:hypothetical protein n=1 Tax=Shewanella waksmanii TaxID=213783 RepID=UPI00049087B9|nr:hypothetical protein [Shewanella waksmanii]